MEERLEQQVAREMPCRRRGGGLPEGRQWPREADSLACSHYQALMTVRRDIHDQVGSALAGMAVQLELAWRMVSMDTRTAHAVLSELRSDVTELIARVRRIGDGRDTSRPPRDMEAALRSMLRQVNLAVAPRLVFSLNVDPDISSVPEEVSSAAFWIVREAVINVLKHSAARHCTVTLSVRDGELQVRVEDDGRVTIRAPSPGSGLINMSARAAEQGGWCTAGPREPHGYAVAACFPLPGARRLADGAHRNQP